MIAPKPLECQNGRKEDLIGFHPELAKKVLAEIRPAYGVFGKPQNVSLDIHGSARNRSAGDSEVLR